MLKDELDPHGVLPQWAPEPLRDTTVIVMLCTTISPNADQIRQIRALIPELGQTTPKSEKFIAFGAQPITTFTVLREYNKRTLTVGGKDHDHASIYAYVQENDIIKPDRTAAYKI